MTKGLKLQLQHRSFHGYSGPISFANDWLDLLAVQGTFKSLLQHHSSKASIPRSNFLYTPILISVCDYWKNHSFHYMDRFGKVMSLLFNILSRFVTAFLPRGKCLLISWQKSPSAVILESKKIVCYCFHCFPIYLPWSDGTGCHDLSFLNIEF